MYNQLVQTARINNCFRAWFAKHVYLFCFFYVLVRLFLGSNLNLDVHRRLHNLSKQFFMFHVYIDLRRSKSIIEREKFRTEKRCANTTCYLCASRTSVTTYKKMSWIFYLRVSIDVIAYVVHDDLSINIGKLKIIMGYTYRIRCNGAMFRRHLGSDAVIKFCWRQC